ncbi:hypothetical protein LBMAG18_03030 [Alphaproteobacteria bacterium]|nr:hypothetical protein LBMAG18_03030 [Alphaproteobacteria bacterium]
MFKKKIICIFLVLVLNSCAMCYVNPIDTEEAKRMYNSIGTYSVNITEEQGKELFGECYNHRTDRVFVYSTFFSKKYILEKYGRPWTYAGARW